MDKPVSDLRQHYTRGELLESAVASDPIAQFRRWFDDALRTDTLEPNAMSLATVDAAGQPSCRVVLLKGIEPEGFVFYTNYTSRKGADLLGNPRAALCLWWPPLERQVRIEGTVRRVSDEQSDAYFASRPRESQLGAVVSNQSDVIPDRAFLERELAALQQRYPDGAKIPRPEHWGGFLLTPSAVEFWQGRPARLHDRLRYTRRAAGDWQIERLAP